MKVIAFPFAGGSKYSFKFIDEKLEKCGIRFSVLEYPGRGSRINEVLISDIEKIVDDIMPSVIKEISEADTYVLYGHSMGGLIGYLVTKQIEKLKLKKPLKLVISGRKAPSVGDQEKNNALSSNVFWERILKLGGVPKEIIKEESIKSFYEAILRSDYKAVEAFNYSEKGQLSIPIDVFYGSEDKYSISEMTPWKLETNREVNTFELKGNHFFIYDHPDYFIDYFKKEFISDYV